MKREWFASRHGFERAIFPALDIAETRAQWNSQRLPHRVHERKV
jgi:hypothetical protein